MNQSTIHALVATGFILIGIFFMCMSVEVHIFCLVPCGSAFFCAAISSDRYELALQKEKMEANDLYERAE